MDRLLYVAMVGASETMNAIGTNANNLANANTTGFRTDLDRLSSIPLTGDQPVTRIYVLDQGAGVDFTPGSLITTGRELDLAIVNEGWLAVQTETGEEVYTRAGNLQVTDTGLLTTAGGLPVLGNGGPVSLPPFEKMEIGNDGTLSVRTPGAPANALAVIDRIRLVNPGNERLRKGEDGLFRLPAGEVAVADAKVQLRSGALESSNVNSVDALIEMISLSRQFETQVKMMKVAEENDEATTSLLRST